MQAATAQRRPGQRGLTRCAAAAIAAIVTILGVACSPGDLVDVQQTSGLVDPSTVRSASGATQLYNYAVARFAQVFSGATTNPAGPNDYVATSGLLTDELMRTQFPVGLSSYYVTNVDERTAGVLGNPIYFALHQPRVEARQAREAMRLYAATTSRVQQGRLYALEGYTLVLFAELYCSGIPLSTIALDGTAVPTPGRSTEELLTQAAAMFDSAIVLAADSARFLNLARVGKARALLGLGQFAAAAAAVQDVPTDFVYNTEHNAANSNTLGYKPQYAWVKDSEGTNGLVWSNDPRTALTTTPSLSGTLAITAKYSYTGSAAQTPTLLAAAASTSVTTLPIRLADGLEARLIEAEADLHAGGTQWLATLNTLRATCVGTAVCAPVAGITAAALPALADPGTPATRLDLVMAERAKWLYLTGHRQGDLRRLARVYGRDPGTLWPAGIYDNPGSGPIAPASTNGTSYGNDYVFQTPASERTANPLYAGCITTAP